jgi:hypothetical protein
VRVLVRLLAVVALVAGATVVASGTASALTGAIFTTDSSCTGVNVNLFGSKDDVYLDGGPQGNGPGLPEGDYFVKVTEPDGTLLGVPPSTTPQVHVDASGAFDACYQLSAILVKESNGTAGYDDTGNAGGEYKVWVSPDSTFPNNNSKTDNFKVVTSGKPTSSLTTEVHDPNHNDITNTVIPAGTEIHDQATVDFLNADNATGDVVFRLLKGITNGETCEGGTEVFTQSIGIDSTESPVVEETDPFTVSDAGKYAFNVVFTSDESSDAPSAGPVCEPFEVQVKSKEHEDQEELDAAAAPAAPLIVATPIFTG